jgi:hypothetical protein
MAAGGTSSNVQLGPGRIYFAPVGTSEPSNASTALPSAWSVLGYTDSGTKFTSTLTATAVEVAEELDPIFYVNTKRENKLEIHAAESMRRNLVMALSGGVVTLNDGTFFEPPNPGTEVAIMMVWDSNEDPTVAGGFPSGGNRRWLFRQCRASGAIEIDRQKAPQKALLPILMNLEKPSGLAPFKVFPNSSGLI